MRKYSKVFVNKDEKLFGYRYNYERNVLEAVSKWDCYIDRVTKKLVDVELDDWVAYDSMGLNVNEWKDNNEYWVDTYANERKMEVSHMADFI